MNDAAAPSATAELGPPERLHPLYLITGIPQIVKGAWGLLAGGALLASQGRWWIAALLVVGSVTFSFLSLLIRWLKLEYRVGTHELRIDSGWLSRTSRAIPFDRVTDVDFEQGPLHRLLGLVRVKLETGASAGGKEEDGVLHTISLDRAEALRAHIRARKGMPVTATGDAEVIDEAAPIFAMGKRRVATAGLFNFSLAVIAGLFGFTQTLGEAVGFDPFRRSFWTSLLDRADPVRDLVVAHQIGAAVAGSLLLILLGVGTGLVRTVLREHGFRLDRTEVGFRRRRGLVTLTDVSIPARRVQAAILASGPVRRHFGWWVLKLQSLARDGARGDHVVAPLVREEEAGAILYSIEWPVAPRTEQWRKISYAFVTSFVIILLPAALIALGTISLLGPIALLWLAGGALAVLVRRLDWKLTRFALDHDMLFIATGWWRHRRSIVPRGKIQSVDLTESWWSRAFGICTLRLGVAGGGGFSDHHVPALTRSEAEALRAELLA
ncbi:PH domain-containing protein [Sphingomonas xanthus]|uniref:PH domain-containing protein n=1 Tax=Sphingomonas xanthus TaxID=2594473 RepID=A0A516ISB2_9SPHN|nr:PH domain-containing protein [Sphingomonas xanthus]QDP19798.1 PH domain-containing protein [Sphingomonas xanthus]